MNENWPGEGSITWYTRIRIALLAGMLVGCSLTPGVPPLPTATPPLSPSPTIQSLDTPSLTVTSTSSPAAAYTATPTSGQASYTPSLSASPEPASTTTPTLEHPLIVSFTVAPAQIDPGDQVTLTWETTAEAVTLCTTMRGGPLAQCWEVDPVGTRTITTHELDRAYAMCLLFAQAGDLHDQASATVTIRCPDTWFFDHPPDVCPYAAMHSSGAIQPFECGTMVWVEGLDAIFILYADDIASPLWDRYPDNWETGMPESDPDLTPPTGLYQPVRGFGLVWRGPQGATITVRDRLGWATGLEVTMDAAYQCDSAPRYNTCYLQIPAGIVVLEPERSGWHLYTDPE